MEINNMKEKSFIAKLFDRNKHKTNLTVERIYNNMNKKYRKKVFYGGLRSAEHILILLAKDVFNNTEDMSIDICSQIYLQTWIRSKGGLKPMFSSPNYIKQALCERFKSIEADVVLKCVDCSLSEIYQHEPELKVRADL